MPVGDRIFFGCFEIQAQLGTRKLEMMRSMCNLCNLLNSESVLNVDQKFTFSICIWSSYWKVRALLIVNKSIISDSLHNNSVPYGLNKI